jgi:hypothetical protein
MSRALLILERVFFIFVSLNLPYARVTDAWPRRYSTFQGLYSPHTFDFCRAIETPHIQLLKSYLDHTYSTFQGLCRPHVFNF